MTLVNYPGSDHQMAQISIDAGYARDIMLMLTDAHAVIAGLAGGEAPAAARQGAAVLRDADGGYDLDGLAGALSEVINWLHQARDHALAGIPPIS
jgi:hypothetical protein